MHRLGGAAVIVLAVASPPTRWTKLGAIAFAASIPVAWMRRDPLPAVAHVEGIVGLSGMLSPALVPLAWTALAWMPFTLLFSTLRPPPRDAAAMIGIGLATYVALTIVVSQVANFPVPVMGLGASPIVGIYVGFGLARRRAWWMPSVTARETLQDGRYVLVGVLGEGTQGRTFDAVDKREGRAVAIKRFDVRGAATWKKTWSSPNAKHEY